MRLVSYTRTTSCYPGAEIPSDVIARQNENIKKYTETKGWKISDRYSDRKKSESENTAFEKLLQDGIQRKFDAVIVDSVFRAGKDLWSAREVLLQTLHYAGIGFIVVEDDYISIGKSNADAEAYFDEKYGILKSENIRHRVLHRNRSGVLSWNDAKYGYKLSDDYQLVIDEETAPVVKRIFQMCANGMTIQNVAATLSAEKVPSPLAKRGVNVKIDDPYKWTRLTVRRLLDKTVYMGHWTKVVQGENIELFNEPIVSEELFLQAQKAIKTPAYTSKKPKAKHRYAGLAYDKEHGPCLHYREGVNGGYFGYAKSELNKDGILRLPVGEVDAAVRTALDEARSRALRLLEKIQSDGATACEERIGEYQAEFRSKALAMAEREKKRMGFYQRFQGEESEMKVMLAEMRSSVAEQEDYFKGHEGFIKRMQIAFGEDNPWISLYRTWEPRQELDKTTLNRYVAGVEIEKLSSIHVKLKEMDWFEELPVGWRL